MICLIASISGFSQIIVDVNDMPAEGDTLRASVALNIPDGFEKTGADTTWNFGMLQPVNQKIDSFVAVSATPPAYWFFFIPGIETNLASPRTSGLIPGIPMTNAFNFYNKTPSAFNDLGFAVTVQGIPLPLKYDKPDKYYSLPFTYNDAWTSESSIVFNIPSIAYYGSQRTRTNTVDGWGTLITPYGSFQTLRVKSRILQFDSIFIDSLGVGIGINREIMEYKWMGKTEGIPLLTITEEGPIISATYRDIPRMPVVPLSMNLGPDTSVAKGTTMDIKARIKGGTPPYQVIWNVMDTGKVITVTIDSTVTFIAICIDAAFNIVSSSKTVTAINPGMDERTVERLLVHPNPAEKFVSFQLPESVREADLTILTLQGNTLKTTRLIPGINNLCTVDVSGLAPGMYMLKVVEGNLTFAGKFVKK